MLLISSQQLGLPIPNATTELADDVWIDMHAVYKISYIAKLLTIKFNNGDSDVVIQFNEPSEGANFAGRIASYANRANIPWNGFPL